MKISLTEICISIVGEILNFQRGGIDFSAEMSGEKYNGFDGNKKSEIIDGCE